MSDVFPVPARVSEIFDPVRWREVEGFTRAGDSRAAAHPGSRADPRPDPVVLTDVTYHRGCVRDADGAWLRDLPVVRVALDRPEVRNAFRPRTVDELYRVLDHARMSGDVGAVVLTGNGPSPRDGGWAFSSGGDQRVRDRDGYRYEREEPGRHEEPEHCEEPGRADAGPIGPAGRPGARSRDRGRGYGRRRRVHQPGRADRRRDRSRPRGGCGRRPGAH